LIKIHYSLYRFPGDLVLCVPPLPIPNREVKAQCADDSPQGESKLCRDISGDYKLKPATTAGFLYLKLHIGKI